MMLALTAAVLLAASPSHAVAKPAVASAAAKDKPKIERFEVTGIARRVRAFRRMEELIVNGDPEAFKERQLLSNRLAAEFLAEQGEVWQKPVNVHALVGYVLMGGDANVLRQLLRRGVVRDEFRDLALGTLALGERRTADARKHLAKVDIRPLPLDLGEIVELARTTLAAIDDPHRAIQRLAELRIRSRGTLIEESALRQQAFMLIKTGDVDEALRVAALYLMRFPRSHFVGSFLDDFGEAVGAGDWARTEEVATKVVSMFSRCPAPLTAILLSAMSRESMLRGRWQSARKAAALALSMMKPDEARREDANVYLLAATVAIGDQPDALARLKALDVSRYKPGERGLIRAAIGIGEQLARRPGFFAYPPALAGGPDGRAAPRDPATEATDFAVRARRSLEKADAEIGRLKP